jgi:ribosomal protein S18 acetylase RimI-like enzyme
MRIRRLAPPDRAAISELLCSDATFADDEIAVALELIDGAIASPDGDYRALVCCDDERVVGYVCYGPTPMTESTWDLYWIATHRIARGKGVASRLVDAMERELADLGARTVRIETSQMEAYGAARSFYSRIAYHEVGRIPDFYKLGDDLIILSKRIDVPAEQRLPRAS